MALRYRTRRRLSLLILVIGLPLYIVAAITVVGWLDRPSFLMELAVYVGLGIVWALPFRAVFLGIGREDPEKSKTEGQGPSV